MAASDRRSASPVLVVVGQAEQVIGEYVVAFGKGDSVEVLECSVQRKFASDGRQLAKD